MTHIIYSQLAVDVRYIGMFSVPTGLDLDIKFGRHHLAMVFYMTCRNRLGSLLCMLSCMQHLLLFGLVECCPHLCVHAGPLFCHKPFERVKSSVSNLYISQAAIFKPMHI